MRGGHAEQRCDIGQCKTEWAGFDRLRDPDESNRSYARRSGTIDRYTRWHLRDWWYRVGAKLLEAQCSTWADVRTGLGNVTLAVPGTQRVLVLYIRGSLPIGHED